MQYIEIILSFVIGCIVAIMLGMVFSLKTRGIMRLVINILAGCVALFLLSLFKVPPFALNPLSAFIVGLSGAIGLVVIFIILTFF